MAKSKRHNSQKAVPSSFPWVPASLTFLFVGALGLGSRVVQPKTPEILGGELPVVSAQSATPDPTDFGELPVASALPSLQLASVLFDSQATPPPEAPSALTLEPEAESKPPPEVSVPPVPASASEPEPAPKPDATVPQAPEPAPKPDAAVSSASEPAILSEARGKASPLSPPRLAAPSLVKKSSKPATRASTAKAHSLFTPASTTSRRSKTKRPSSLDSQPSGGALSLFSFQATPQPKAKRTTPRKPAKRLPLPPRNELEAAERVVAEQVAFLSKRTAAKRPFPATPKRAASRAQALVSSAPRRPPAHWFSPPKSPPPKAQPSLAQLRPPILAEPYIKTPESLQSDKLTRASAAGWTGLVGQLLDRGAPVQGRNATGATALHAASEAGHWPVVRLLLSRGADPSQTDAVGWTPLMNAIYRNKLAVVQELLAAGSALQTKDGRGTSVAHLARASRDSMIRKLVLERLSE